jgi:formylglycine-generating enzyme required for sulfatase activity
MLAAEPIDQADAEKRLRDILVSVGLPVKASYRPGEVCQILSITPPTFYTMINRYETDEAGKPRRPDSLDSFRLVHYRVSFPELARFIARNNSWHRACCIYNDAETPVSAAGPAKKKPAPVPALKPVNNDDRQLTLFD